MKRIFGGVTNEELEKKINELNQAMNLSFGVNEIVDLELVSQELESRGYTIGSEYVILEHPEKK